jgi:hypothetical protein
VTALTAPSECQSTPPMYVTAAGATPSASSWDAALRSDQKLKNECPGILDAGRNGQNHGNEVRQRPQL